MGDGAEYTTEYCMNDKLAKKIRKANRHGWRNFYLEIKRQSFSVRWGIAWYILFGKREV